MLPAVVLIWSTAILTGWAAGITAQDAVSELLQKTAAAESQGDSAQAAELATRVIKQDPSSVYAYYLRGRAHFRLGQIPESIADFDKCLELAPEHRSQLWERGISLYYGAQFDRAAKQFVFCHMYQENDVENSIWRYLSMARTVGVQKAREEMLPVFKDSRVPMMEIYNLYRGKLKPKDVLKAAQAGAPTREVLKGRLFHAHLYLGLYYDAAGQKELAREHMSRAAGEYKMPNYVGDVARRHARLLQEENKE